MKKKTIIILLIVVIVLGLILGGGYILFKDSFKFSKACNLAKEKKYEEAIKLFDELGEYNNSMSLSRKHSYDYAVILVDNGENDKAEIYYEKAIGYKDAQDRFKELTYNNMLSSLEKNDFEKALEKANKIPGYKDASEKLVESKYGYAVDNLSKENETTKGLLEELVVINYLDSREKYNETFGEYKGSFIYTSKPFDLGISKKYISLSFSEYLKSSYTPSDVWSISGTLSGEEISDNFSMPGEKVNHFEIERVLEHASSSGVFQFKNMKGTSGTKYDEGEGRVTKVTVQVPCEVSFTVEKIVVNEDKLNVYISYNNPDELTFTLLMEGEINTKIGDYLDKTSLSKTIEGDKVGAIEFEFTLKSPIFLNTYDSDSYAFTYLAKVLINEATYEVQNYKWCYYQGY